MSARQFTTASAAVFRFGPEDGIGKQQLAISKIPHASGPVALQETVPAISATGFG
jgi:hypothetical protein